MRQDTTLRGRNTTKKTGIRISAKDPNPTLDTIEMVELQMHEKMEYPSKNQLWRSLPKQVQYPTFKKVLEYLEKSNKIMYDKNGAILWIFTDNEKLEQLHKESTKLR